MGCPGCIPEEAGTFLILLYRDLFSLCIDCTTSTVTSETNMLSCSRCGAHISRVWYNTSNANLLLHQTPRHFPPIISELYLHGSART